MHPTSRTAARYAAAIVLALPTTAAAQEAAEAGFVLSVRGEWFASSRSSEPLASGQVLVSGDRVWAGLPRSPGQSLSVALYADGGRLELRCADQSVCDRRHTIRGGGSDQVSIREMLAAAAGLVREGPDRFITLITRSGTPLREAVLGAGPDGIDLAPALGDLAPDEVWLEAAALDSATSPGPWRSLRVSWKPGMPALVPSNALPPGLYALRLYDQPDSEAWVLVGSGPADAARFQEISTLVRMWPGDNNALKDARTVLRAVLLRLALYSAASGHAP